jgi:hypothetical protein
MMALQQGAVAKTVASWITDEKERLLTHHFWEPDMATNVR